jgi:hypothetical protein
LHLRPLASRSRPGQGDIEIGQPRRRGTTMSLSIPIPDTYTFEIDVRQLPPINVGVSKINIGLDQIDLKLEPITITPLELKIDPLDIKLEPLDIKVEPLDMSFRIKELPSMRVHFPVDYRFCVALLGTELMSLSICGQGQVITEPYVPNPCECQPGRVIRPIVEPLTPVKSG